MTFSLRKLLFVAPVFSAVGIASACGPYPAPNWPVPSYPPTQAPQTLYYEPVTNARGQTTYVMRSIPAAPPTQAPGTSLSVVNGKLHLQGVDGSKMTCEKLTILVSGAEPAEVSVAEKLIKITSGKDVKGGELLQATAQKVTRIGAEGATLVLEGNAKLVYARQGKKIDVSTDLLSVNLLTGQVISELNAPRPTTPPPPPGCAPSPPLPSGTASPAFRPPSPSERSTQPLPSTAAPRNDSPPPAGPRSPAPPPPTTAPLSQCPTNWDSAARFVY